MATTTKIVQISSNDLALVEDAIRDALAEIEEIEDVSLGVVRKLELALEVLDVERT